MQFVSDIVRHSGKESVPDIEDFYKLHQEARVSEWHCCCYALVGNDEVNLWLSKPKENMIDYITIFDSLWLWFLVRNPNWSFASPTVCSLGMPRALYRSMTIKNWGNKMIFLFLVALLPLALCLLRHVPVATRFTRTLPAVFWSLRKWRIGSAANAAARAAATAPTIMPTCARSRSWCFGPTSWVRWFHKNRAQLWGWNPVQPNRWIPLSSAIVSIVVLVGKSKGPQVRYDSLVVSGMSSNG